MSTQLLPNAATPAAQRGKVKVLVVDDSALIRQLLTGILSKDPGIEVVGTAIDPYMAWEKVRQLNPDVITLDVEMPRMDGLTFLEKLMRARPTPVLMISSLTERGAETTLRALELGAADFVSKPKIDVQRGTAELAREITSKIHAIAAARIPARRAPGAVTAAGSSATAMVNREALIKSTHKVIAIGASTGGTEALRDVLTAMPAGSPGMVIVQHMPEKFTRAFADRLNSLCKVQVKEAADGDRILPGHVLLAPGGLQMEVQRAGAEYSVRVFNGDPVNRHRPSVDVMFNSCARFMGANAVGAILTGMGNDGAAGLLSMRRAGARTVAQDEASCVVFGMPKEAIKMGGVQEVVPLPRVADTLLRLLAD